MTDAQARNERIASWFEPSLAEPFEYYDIEGTLVKTIVCPDFDTDESANAMLLEAMPYPCVRKRENGWVCLLEHTVADSEAKPNLDRKIAIRLAFMRFIGAENDIP